MDLHEFTFRLLPATCIACGLPTGVRRDLCHPCEKRLPFIEHGCLYCSIPLQSANQRCGQCTVARPLYSAAICLFVYAYPVNRLINRFKEHQQLATGRVLGQLFSKRHSELLTDLHDRNTLVVPVPLHRSKKRERGFNQSEIFASIISNALGTRVSRKVLVRSKKSMEQKHIQSVERRRNNMAGVFSCVSNIRGKRILLVDDVITSGATVNEATATLLAAGAEDVVVLALARTPDPGNSARAIL